MKNVAHNTRTVAILNFQNSLNNKKKNSKYTLWHVVLHGESNFCNISSKKPNPATQEGPTIFKPDINQSQTPFYERNLNFVQKKIYKIN
jgi:hypothetical protein